MIIEKSMLSNDVYESVIEENILRGADQFEGSLENEVERTDIRIKNGDLLLVFSQLNGTVTLVSKEDYAKGTQKYLYEDER